MSNIGIQPPPFPIGAAAPPPVIGSIDDEISSSTAAVLGFGLGSQNPGVVGSSANGDGVQGFTIAIDQHGVVGSNQATDDPALGFLAGPDPVFNENAGVYGQSDRQGVMGLTTGESGTGVYGGGASRDGSVGGHCSKVYCHATFVRYPDLL